MRTYQSVMEEIEAIQAEQRALTKKTAPSADDKARLLKLEGKIETLRTVADEAHDAEVEEMRRVIDEATPAILTRRPAAGETWRDLTTGHEVRALSPAEPLSAGPESGLSFGRALRAMALGTWAGAEDEHRALGEASGSAGGYLVPDILSRNVIDKARSLSVCVQAGVRTVPFTDDGMGDSLTLARVTADPSVAWVGEAGTITPSDPSFGAVVLSANKLACLIRASRELLRDAPNGAAVIEKAVAGAMAAEIDRAILECSGAGAEPSGLAVTSGVSAVEMDTDGAVPTNGSSGTAGAPKLLECYTTIQGDNHQPNAMVSSPRTFGTFAGLVDSTYQPLNLPAPIAALPWLVTTNVSDEAEQGSSGAVCSTLYMGDWTRGMLGVRQQIEVYITRDVYLANDEVALLVTWRGDFQPEDPAAFCRLVGIKAP